MFLFRRPARAFFQIIGVLTVIGLAAAALALPLLPRILQVEDTIGKADYILPLAGDWHRLIKTAELYKAGYAPKVVLSNSRIRPPKRIDRLKTEMGIQHLEPREFRKRLMIHLGVPQEALTSFGDGHISTAEEAEAFRKFVNDGGARSQAGKSLRVILVTSPYHTRRAKMTFEQAMPDTAFLLTSPPEDKLNAQWWRDQRSAQIAVSEAFKFTYYLLGGRFQSRASHP
jgi:uncharacterized SAM-binding protein YcdF (DUF218 family)